MDLLTMAISLWDSKSFIQLYGKRTDKARYQFLIENAQNEIFEIFKMFKNNIKFTRAVVELT